MQAQLTAATVNVQGIGWGALAWEPVAGRLVVEQIHDHQGNVGAGSVPLLVIDSWEHAYYLQYKNVKADFVKAFWNIVNWQDVAARFERARTVPPTCLSARGRTGDEPSSHVEILDDDTLWRFERGFLRVQLDVHLGPRLPGHPRRSPPSSCSRAAARWARSSPTSTRR